MEAGKVGKTKIESIPDYNHFTKTYFVNARELDVYVQISNYHYGKGGFWKSLEIGTPDTITKEREINLGLDLFISGALLIMGIYHLSLYSLRTVDKSTLWFGVMCILVFIRTLVTGEYFLYELYPNINFELAVKLEYLSFYLSFPVFTLFIRGIFIEFYQRYFRWSVIFSVLFAVPVVILEANVYTKFINIFQIVFLISLIYILFILIKLSFNKNVDARIFLLTKPVGPEIITNAVPTVGSKAHHPGNVLLMPIKNSPASIRKKPAKEHRFIQFFFNELPLIARAAIKEPISNSQKRVSGK